MADQLQPDSDIELMDRSQLKAEIAKLRAAVRLHHDSVGHDLCWFWPELWRLLPEFAGKTIAPPPWPEFMRCCVLFRTSCERPLTIYEIEQLAIYRALRKNNGNKVAVAAELGMSLKTVYNKLNQYELEYAHGRTLDGRPAVPGSTREAIAAGPGEGNPGSPDVACGGHS